MIDRKQLVDTTQYLISSYIQKRPLLRFRLVGGTAPEVAFVFIRHVTAHTMVGPAVFESIGRRVSGLIPLQGERRLP